jgi:hypothetical protein
MPGPPYEPFERIIEEMSGQWIPADNSDNDMLNESRIELDRKDLEKAIRNYGRG